MNTIKLEISRLREKLNIEKLKLDQVEDGLRLQDPEFYSNSDYVEILKRYNSSSEIINKYSTLVETEQLLNIAEGEDVKILSEECKKLISELKTNQTDDRETYLTITAGIGGVEACDFAQMLMKMYLTKNKSGVVIDVDENSIAGINSCTLKFPHYSDFMSETGIHRLVRVSPFNAQGKRMTSFATVIATPVVDCNIQVELDPHKLSFDYFRSGGAGGQNVNKVETGVRARYEYDGELILVRNTETRDQRTNKENALKLLRAIIHQRELEKVKNERVELRYIRSYVLDKGYVKNHLTGEMTEMKDIFK